MEGAESNPHAESAEITPVTPLVLMSSATVGDWTFAAWAGRCDEPLTFRLERKGEPLEWEPTQTGRQAWTTVNIEALRGALGHDGFLLSYETSATLPPCEWEYWIPDGDRLRLAARSFGRKDEGDGIWPVDLDGDGVNELVCNVSFVNGPHPQVHVFRNAGGTIEFCDNVRPVLLEPEGLPGPETWSRYDPATANGWDNTLAITDFTNVDSKRYFCYDVNLELFQRIRIVNTGKTNKGLHWDLGIFGGLHANEYIVSYNENQNPGAAQLQTNVYSEVEPASNWNWGLTSRLVWNWIGIYGRYRMSQPSLDLPRLELGIQLSF